MIVCMYLERREATFDSSHPGRLLFLLLSDTEACGCI